MMLGVLGGAEKQKLGVVLAMNQHAVYLHQRQHKIVRVVIPKPCQRDLKRSHTNYLKEMDVQGVVRIKRRELFVMEVVDVVVKKVGFV
jgi:hypothetical protein